MAQAEGEITVLLRQWNQGSRQALDQLMPLVYEELRNIAAGYLRREPNTVILQPTVVVHELYFVLQRQRKVALQDRKHFFTFAAHVMRRILVDHARSALAGKRRGPSASHVPLGEELPWVNLESEDTLDLDIALAELEAVDETRARVVELRYFLGCTAEETADLLGLSRSTVDREARLAKAWLYYRLRGSGKKAAYESL